MYPIQSPNGSTVILYGHENGVKIVWRGGRAFKLQKDGSGTRQKTNGDSSAAIISLDDSDEEMEPAKKAYEDKPDFEAYDEELNPLQPYPSIVQELDLWFGTDVLHLAVLPAPILKADGPSWRSMESLKQKIVFTAACADNSVRLVTLPLTPPSPASKSRSDLRSDFSMANAGKGTWGERMVTLAGHQKPPSGVSITVELGTPKTGSTVAEPQIIVASHSKEVTGLLLLYRVEPGTAQKHIEPFQSVCLASPAKAIAFNPSLSPQSSTHLLVAESTGICRIYDYKRSMKTSEESSETNISDQGAWLLSLYAGFQNTKNDSQPTHQLGSPAGFGRKTVVDAQWVSGGRAVMVLLNDGEWAVWDIDGAGPGASQGLLGRQGVKGGSKTEYSLTGYVVDATTRSRTSGPPQIASSKFAPMTPGTRKSADPFSGRGGSGSTQGQISVIEVRPASSNSPAEESLLLWLGETFAVIPNLGKYWATNAQKTGGSGSLFTGPTGSRLIKLDAINLQGERCSGVEQIANTASSSGLPSEVLILGEHRFILLSSGKASRLPPGEKTGGRLALVERSTNGGELDVVGIEQALARMENGGGAIRKIFPNVP